jgi:hypothetical protein
MNEDKKERWHQPRRHSHAVQNRLDCRQTLQLVAALELHRAKFNRFRAPAGMVIKNTIVLG